METLPLTLFPLGRGGVFNIFDATRCFMDSINLGQVFMKAPSSLDFAKAPWSVSAVRAWLC